MADSNDNELSGKQHIDGLMRRVVFLLFVAGELAMLSVWAMEGLDGTLNAVNRVAYPLMAVVCLACSVALWRWPRVLLPIRWVGFVCVTGVLLVELGQEATKATPFIGSYNAVTLLNWLPLCYALGFFMLEARHASWATAGILAYVAGIAVWRGTQPWPFAAADRSLLLNTLVSHLVLVVCLSGMLWLKRVVTQQGEQAQRLRLLAGTDPLTGLANRRQGLRLLESLLRDRRGQGSPVVMIADLDHFKRVNDDCGHDVGDRVLVAVAAALRANTRETDTVARWGGEEFLVLLPHTGPGEALELAERLRACVETLVVADGHGRPVRLTLSLGLAGLATDDTVAAWVRRADQALYRAKAGGRNQCEMAKVPGADKEERPALAIGT